MTQAPAGAPATPWTTAPAAGARLALGAGLAAVLLSALLAYLPALDGDFTYDDHDGIVGRHGLADAAAHLAAVPAAILGRGGRAVADLTFAFDLDRAGLAPRAFHETGLAIHLAAVAAAFLVALSVLRRAGAGGPGAALAAAALFGLHPLASEAVAYLVQRQEALAALLALLAVAGALRAEARLDRLGWTAYAAGTAAFALALGAKSSAVVAPAAFLLVALAFPGPAAPGEPPGPRWRRALGLAAPWLALSAAHLTGLLGLLGGQATAGFQMHHVRAAPYWLAQGRVLLRYLGMTLWPAGQSVDHDFRLSAEADAASVLSLAAVALLAAAALAALLRGRGPLLRLAGFAVAWFLLVLLPTSVLPIRDVLVEHRVYLALVGPAVLVAALGGRLAGQLGAGLAGQLNAGLAGQLDAGLAGRQALRAPALVGAALCLAALTPLFLATRARAALWGDPVALWADASEKGPDAFRPSANLGLLLARRGDAAGAVAAFERATAADPAMASAAPLMAVAHGRALLGLGRAAQARTVLARRLERHPADAEAHGLLALALRAEGRFADACAALARARTAVAPEEGLQLAGLAASMGCR